MFFALNKGNRSVEIKYPCVRVNYMKNDEVDFHVDLAIYCKEDDEYYIAKGKPIQTQTKFFGMIQPPEN